jgi:hypothetical protein
MPPYIPLRIKRPKQQITVKLYQDRLAMLDQYGRFIEDSRDYIIDQALDLVFKKDRAFLQWLEQRSGNEKAEDTSANPEHRATQSRQNQESGGKREVAGRESLLEPTPQKLPGRLVSSGS